MSINVNKSRARTKIDHFVEMGVLDVNNSEFLLIVVIDYTTRINRLCNRAALECITRRRIWGGLHCAGCLP